MKQFYETRSRSSLPPLRNAFDFIKEVKLVKNQLIVIDRTHILTQVSWSTCPLYNKIGKRDLKPDSSYPTNWL